MMVVGAGCSFADDSDAEDVQAAGRSASEEQAPSLFDPAPAWPLCGRITEAAPKGWTADSGCPADRFGNPHATDQPLSSTFGPRLKASDGFRYDFHRGIDLPTPTGTPVFAITAGQIRKAGQDPSYSDALVQIRHFRPGHPGSCESGGGCYVSNYLHLSAWTVAVGETVRKGQLIGYTGASDSGFEHLHFEIRNATANDPLSAWQRHAIHPLAVLPYASVGESTAVVSIDTLDATERTQPRITVSVTIPDSQAPALNRVELELYRRSASGELVRIEQPGEHPTGATPEGDGYHIDPPWFEMAGWNRHYTHQDSEGFGWSAFGPEGSCACPFHDTHPDHYDANAHLDHATPYDPHVGSFNGALIEPGPFNAESARYALTLTFVALQGAADADGLCARARALDARGNRTEWTEHVCTPSSRGERAAPG